MFYQMDDQNVSQVFRHYIDLHFTCHYTTMHLYMQSWQVRQTVLSNFLVKCHLEMLTLNILHTNIFSVPFTLSVCHIAPSVMCKAIKNTFSAVNHRSIRPMTVISNVSFMLYLCRPWTTYWTIYRDGQIFSFDLYYMYCGADLQRL